MASTCPWLPVMSEFFAPLVLQSPTTWAASVPVSAPESPLEPDEPDDPEEPDDPLDPELPLDPLDPEEPDVPPEVPLVPDVPPEEPLVPEEPPVSESLHAVASAPPVPRKTTENFRNALRLN